MKTRVFFHSAGASARKNRLDKVAELFERSGFADMMTAGQKVAIKVHWGEPGNVGYIQPPYVRRVVELVQRTGASPYVTDTNTLYTGMRRDGVHNVLAAAHNGFSLATVGAPIIVADGVGGHDGREVVWDEASGRTARIASGILDADAMIVLSHIKSHMLFGFGGALKNLGMGCTTPAGKQALHSDLRPQVKESACRADGICIRYCPEQCIQLVDRTQPVQGLPPRTARIDTPRCVGCGECTAACPHGAIPVRWKTSAGDIQRKTAEYALAAVKDKPGRVGYINFIIQVTPDCDCANWNEPPFVPDVGFMASTDPVAIDTASTDLVRQTPPSPGGKADGCQGDPWRAVYDIDYTNVLEHAERIGLGQREYELVKLT